MLAQCGGYDSHNRQRKCYRGAKPPECKAEAGPRLQHFRGKQKAKRKKKKYSANSGWSFANLARNSLLFVALQPISASFAFSVTTVPSDCLGRWKLKLCCSCSRAGAVGIFWSKPKKQKKCKGQHLHLFLCVSQQRNKPGSTMPVTRRTEALRGTGATAFLV